MEEEDTLVRAYDLKHAGKRSPSKSSPYSLYFKCEETESSAEFRVVICGYKDGLMFEMKGPVDSSITLLEAELIVLKFGLTEAVRLGISHISISCDNNQIFEWVMGRSVPEQENMALLMRDVQGIRKQLTSSIAIKVTRNQVEFAHNVVKKAISSQTKTDTTTCSICLDDDINADQMFYVGNCRHVFCSECVKRHIEVRLAEGYLMTCPHYRCKCELTYERCYNILTPKLKEMWEQRIKEDSIRVTERVYCPNPTCSALMSVTKLYQLSGDKACCEKCGEPFCIKCKVPWHNNLSCDRYKKLHPNPTENDGKLKKLANKRRWRQCRKCQQMIELTLGCVTLKCRCGHQFCYTCGADDGYCSHGHGYRRGYEHPMSAGPMLEGLARVVFGIAAFIIICELCF